MNNKGKFWIALILVAVFAAGVGGGILLERFLDAKKYERRERRPPPFPSIEGMAEELELSPGQQVKMREIFQKNDERLKEVRSLLQSRLAEIRSQLKKEIDSILTPEQRTKLEAMIEKHVSQRKKEKEHERRKEKGVPR